MMMGMMDNAVGINYSTNRPQFPPPHAHAGVPNTVPNHIPQPVQTLQNPQNAAILPQLQQQQQQPPQQQQPVPTPAIQPTTSSNANNTNKPKKPRKKKSADGSGLHKSDYDLKLKKKKNANKDKPKSKPKKPSDGSKYHYYQTDSNIPLVRAGFQDRFLVYKPNVNDWHINLTICNEHILHYQLNGNCSNHVTGAN